MVFYRDGDEPTIAERLAWAQESLGRYPENESERLSNVSSAVGDLLRAVLLMHEQQKQEVERLRAALVALVGDEYDEPWAPAPYGGDMQCFFCGADYGEHHGDCAWVAAKALLAAKGGE